MLLGARQFFERRGAPTPPLPYDAEVEYLESTGTQYIDTLIPGTTDTEFMIDAQTTVGGTMAICGFGSASAWHDQMRILFQFNNPGNPQYDTNSSYPVYSVKSNLRHLYECGASFSIDGTVYYQNISRPAVTNNLNFFIFGANRGTFNNPSSMMCFSFKMYTDGVLRRDMIPVRFRDESNLSEGAMYDRVSGQLFRNQGTSAFTIGPDK